jgi:hypothetical protein
MHVRGSLGLIGLIWIIVGIIVAWKTGVLDMGFLKDLVSVLLTVILWPLPLLGISLHVS